MLDSDEFARGQRGRSGTFITTPIEPLNFMAQRRKYLQLELAFLPSPVQSNVTFLLSHGGRNQLHLRGLTISRLARFFSSLSILSSYTHYLQIKAEARYLICCDAPPLYRPTRMFGHIMEVCCETDRENRPAMAPVGDGIHVICNGIGTGAADFTVTFGSVATRCDGFS